jgi:DnaK suppressor protein
MLMSRPLEASVVASGHLALAEDQREELREHLLGMLDSETQRMERLEAEQGPNAVPRELVDTSVAIQAALAKLDDGTYGVCEGCEGPIGIERLEAIPHARACVTCQQRPRSLFG